MSVSNELMELLSAALGKSAAAKKKPAATKKKAAPALDEINGIELHDDSESPTVAPKPKLKKAPAPRDEDDADTGMAAPKVKKVAKPPAPKAPKEVPAVPKAKRLPVKAMPHNCSCPHCPLKE